MNEDGVVKVTCKYRRYKNIIPCHNKDFKCGKVFICCPQDGRYLEIKWTSYLINIKHLIEFKG